MHAHHLPARSVRSIGSSLCQIRLWQLSVLILLVAVAIVDIRDHGRREPVLVGLAAVGYAGFGLLCWLSWHGFRRFSGRLPRLAVLAAYALSMGVTFLIAVIVYLLIEHVYLGGTLI